MGAFTPLPGTQQPIAGGPPGPAPDAVQGVPAAPPAAPEVTGPASSVLADVNNILRSGRNVAEQFPAAVPIVKKINDLVQELQIVIIQSIPPQEPMTPPV